MNKRILRAKEAEISKAGRMVFDAIFGDSDEFEQKLSDELDAEDGDEREVITVEAHSLVRCGGCGREQSVPTSVDVRVLEQHGWRFAAGDWRCPFCVQI
jgi:hypothetical protein